MDKTKHMCGSGELEGVWRGRLMGPGLSFVKSKTDFQLDAETWVPRWKIELPLLGVKR